MQIVSSPDACFFSHHDICLSLHQGFTFALTSLYNEGHSFVLFYPDALAAVVRRDIWIWLSLVALNILGNHVALCLYCVCVVRRHMLARLQLEDEV